VRKLALAGALIVGGCSLLFVSAATRAPGRAGVQQQTQPPGQPTTQQAPPPVAPPQQTSPPVPVQPVHTGPVIVLDPGHGGTDTGARGESGAIEKEVVLQYAQVVRGQLESQGFRVVMTRTDDSNPSYADRAAIANAYRDAIFISLHVSSTGPVGTARVYYYGFGSSPTGPPAATTTTASSVPLTPSSSSLIPWDQAQLPYVQTSHRLADMLQGELAQRFAGSPISASEAAVRELRSVNEPAVAVEVSSVSVPDPSPLSAMAAPLAASIARGIQAFQSAGSAGGN